MTENSREETFRFLIDLNAAVQPLSNPDEIMTVTARMLGDRMGVDRCAYANVEDQNIFVITGDYPKGAPSIIGRWPVAAFGKECARLMLANQSYVVVDSEKDARIGPEDLPAYRATNIAAVICIPLHKEGKFTAAMAVHQTKPRTWTPSEIELVELVVARCWESLERAQVISRLQESERMLEERVQERTMALEAANRELEAFSYSVSHDLRAPLRSIDGFSQAILDDAAGKLDEGAMDSLRRVRKAAQRMSDLIDCMLSLSRVNRQEMVREAVDLSGLARTVLEDLSRADPARKVDVAVAEGLKAHGDPKFLRIILDNMLGNAWKFTSGKSPARIEVGSLMKDGVPVFFIKDNGAGFDMAYAGKLFGAFQRLHGVQEFSGTGIGLATVHRVVSRHGGKIWAEAEVGAGACFYFTLAPGDPVRN